METKKKTQRGRAAAIFLAALIVLSAVPAAVAPAEAQAAEAPFVVYLQAGHSPSDMGSGNINGGVKEATLNEQVTIRTYHALKQAGFHVLLLNPVALDRTLPSVIKAPPGEKAQYAYYSPEPAMLTAVTWPERFDSTYGKRADVVVSLHHNAYSSSSVRGYEIYYANSTGGDYGRTAADVVGSKKLADLMGEEFAKGFYVPPRSPAVRVNNSHNGLTKNAPTATVLVEAGYMSNAQDLAACRSASNQEILARRVTSAVSRYKNEYWKNTEAAIGTRISATALNATYSASTNILTVDTVLAPASSVKAAWAAIWPKEGNSQSAVWYALNAKGGGRYVANAGAADLGGSGTYTVSIYAANETGNRQNVASTYATISGGDSRGPAAKAVTAALTSPGSNSAVVTAAGVTDESSVSSVKFAVWSATGGQDDLIWYPGTKSGDDWTAVFRTSSHLGRTGLYYVHAYGTDGRGNESMLGIATVTFGGKDTDPPELFGELTYTKIGTKMVVEATDVRDESGVAGVRVAFWSTTGSQKDLVWYPCSREGSSNWVAVVDLNKHQNDNGRYTMHAYAADEKGNDGMVAGLSFRVAGTSQAAAAADKVTAVETAGRTANIVVSGLRSSSPLSSVDVAVWPVSAGQSATEWFPASRVTASTWVSTFAAAKFGGAAGPYTIRVYATDEDDTRTNVGTATFTFQPSADSEPPTAAAVIPDKTTYSVYADRNAAVTIKDVKDATGVQSVWLDVQRIDKAGGTAKRISASRAGEDWTAVINWPMNFLDGGTYEIAAYASDALGNEGRIGRTEVNVGSGAILGYPIMGRSQATVEQLVNTQLKMGWSNSWYGMTVEDFCRLYYDICEQEGVRAEIAYAQMLHETGGLKYGNLVSREQMNFAGLGATGSTFSGTVYNKNHRYTADGKDAGIAFASVENGIRSHVQHLKAYGSSAKLVLPMVDEYDRFGYVQRGCAPTILQLSGRWATDPKYGDQLTSYVHNILRESPVMPVYDTELPLVSDVEKALAGAATAAAPPPVAVTPAETAPPAAVPGEAQVPRAAEEEVEAAVPPPVEETSPAAEPLTEDSGLDGTVAEEDIQLPG